MIRDSRKRLKTDIASRNLEDNNSSFEFRKLLSNTTTSFNSSRNSIWFVVEGTVSISFNQFKDVAFNADELFMIPNSSSIKIESKSNSTVGIYSFDFIDDNWISTRIERLSTIVSSVSYNFQAIKSPRALSMFFSSMYEFQHDLSRSEFNKIKEKELFYILFNYLSNFELFNIFHHLISNDMTFKTFVYKNYLNARGVKELADISGYSLSTFKRRFYENFGESVYTWMQKQKSNHILHKFQNEKVIFSEIITTYGFSSPSHFTRFCKKYYGTTPSELRENPECYNKID